MRRNLIIDVGNTRIKSALFWDDKLVDDHFFARLDEALSFWATLAFDTCLVSSVGLNTEELTDRFPFPFRMLDHHTPLPISNGYATPQTLGLDRIAAAVGAWHLAGKNPVLAIDMGSCITFEFVDGCAVYRGGSISPGLAMRARAMNSFTSRLPLVDLGCRPTSPLGDSTISCMQAGIWYGVDFELAGQIDSYRLKIPEINVYICGGDSQSFESLAKDHIFVVPNLVLHGLNCILNHNVE